MKKKPRKMAAVKILLDEEIRARIEQFRTEFRDGNVPMEYLMPFLMLLGIYAYRRGIRMEKGINLD